MTSNMREQFMPTSHMKNAQYQKDSQKYETIKFEAKMELSLIESCMGKCAVSF
jgi:hypothetical protein